MRAALARADAAASRPSRAAIRYDNAGAALAALDRLEGFLLGAGRAARRGFAAVEWPARLQRLSRGALGGAPAARLGAVARRRAQPGGRRGAGCRRRQLARDQPLHLVFGMRRNHDPRALLLPLVPFVANLMAVAIPGEAHALTAAEVALAAREVGIPAVVQSNLGAAVAGATAAMASPGRILICGSLYLAGQVLHENG